MDSKASPEDRKETKRCGFISLIGAPNAGKSTLTNALVGEKVSIVSHKVQTTRSPLRGIAFEGKSQLILIDSPGIFMPRRRLDRAMIKAAWGGAKEADITVTIIDALKGVSEQETLILNRLSELSMPVLLVLNKVDKVKKDRLLGLTEEVRQKAQGLQALFMISALTGEGVADLKSHLAKSVPKGPWHYPEDQVADATLRAQATELTREKLYLRLHQELPYAATVETTEWKRLKDGALRIEQTIFIERESQKKIVLGKKGETIKAISMDARKDISKITSAKIHLFLFVKVEKKWGDNPEHYRKMGLDFPKS